MNFELLKMTATINLFALFKIPAMAFISPRIIELDEKRSVVQVKLGLRTRNHLNVMYFGALAMGAELSIALRAVQAIEASGKRIDFLFADFKAEFLKRADGHVHFICEEGDKVAALVESAAASTERKAKTFSGYAVVVGNPSEPVMKYQLTLSMKQRAKKA